MRIIRIYYLTQIGLDSDKLQIPRNPQDEVITSLKRELDEMDERVKTFTNKCRHIESTTESTKNKVAEVEKAVKKLKSGN